MVFMATNASTWFYKEPEHRPYLINERVNHTFWSNRMAAIHLDCTSAEPPFRMTGEWHAVPVEIEWVPNTYFKLSAGAQDDISLLMIGVKEVLGFNPTISYVDPEGRQQVEWHVKEMDRHIQEIQGNPNYRNIKTFK
jgi:hypothetical protein